MERTDRPAAICPLTQVLKGRVGKGLPLIKHARCVYKEGGTFIRLEASRMNGHRVHSCTICCLLGGVSICDERQPHKLSDQRGLASVFFAHTAHKADVTDTLTELVYCANPV